MCASIIFNIPQQVEIAQNVVTQFVRQQTVELVVRKARPQSNGACVHLLISMYHNM